MQTNISNSRVAPKTRASVAQAKSVQRTYIIIGAIILIALLGIFFLWKTPDQKQNNNQPTPSVSPTPTPTEDTTQKFNETPATDGATFFEKFPVIGGQQAYVAYPLQIDKKNPPVVIVYSHGSITTITTNMKDPFMQDMRDYAAFFTQYGFVFTASAMHGENWGSQASVNDMDALAKWVKDNYPTADKINLVAHSMGGLPTIKYAMQFPDKVAKVALLAPTSRSESYTKTDILKLANESITIWHGDKDVNVPLSLSTQFVALAKKYGVIITLNILKGKTHWDVDTELKQEILDFYEDVPSATTPSITTQQ